MYKTVIFLAVITSCLFSQNIPSVKDKKVEVIQQPYNPNFDCSILVDENSIICKFEVIRDPINEQLLVVNWIKPNGEISRNREMIIPAGDTSAYDYRSIDGREYGIWEFRILYNQKEYSTQFDLKK